MVIRFGFCCSTFVVASMSSSSDAETMDVPGFFEVKGRSGNPTTEELHARASKPKVGREQKHTLP